MSSFNTVSVIGCGWFGLPLAKHLLGQGYKVKGCKRSAEGVTQLAAVGIDAYRLDLDLNEPVSPGLLEADAIVINLPPGMRRGDTGYLDRLARLSGAMVTRPSRLIFISTTGVYPDLPQSMTESDACVHSAGAALLLGAEALFAGTNTTVVRFAGLVGPARHPGRFFAGKTDIRGGQMPVNIVHLNDCVAAVSALIAAPEPAAVYNLCAPLHPDKRTFYTEAARCMDLPLPEFAGDELQGKTIDGSFICRSLNFQYCYGDPMALLADTHAFSQ